jgi:hypothetical protein
MESPGGREMERLAQIGGGAYCIVAFVIGVRLIRLSARTRQLPELLIGMGVLFLAGLGYPLSAVAREIPSLGASSRATLGAAAGLLAVVGLVANTGFTWIIFRRAVPWASTLFASVGLGAAGLFVAQSVAGGWRDGALFWAWLPIGIMISFGWAFVECGRYYLLLRRRLHLGMADSVVTNRFGLYAVATGLAVVTNLAGWVFWQLHLEMLTHPVGGPLLFVLGVSSSALMMLAFLPPRAYLAWVRARAPEAA